MAELRVLPSAKKFLKRIKDKQLKKLYKNAMDDIDKDSIIGSYNDRDA